MHFFPKNSGNLCKLNFSDETRAAQRQLLHTAGKDLKAADINKWILTWMDERHSKVYISIQGLDLE